jgi:hypothetical protein
MAIGIKKTPPFIKNSNAEISSIIHSIYEQHTHNKLEKNYLKELNNNVNLTMESAKRMIDFAVFAQEYASKLEENLEKERLAKENGNVETTEPRWYYEGEPLFATSWYQEINFWMPLPKLPEGL